MPVPDYLAASDERNTVQIFQIGISGRRQRLDAPALERYLFSLDTMEVPAGTGTGFVWDREGHIVTNVHVINDASKVMVTFKNGRSAARPPHRRRAPQGRRRPEGGPA